MSGGRNCIILFFHFQQPGEFDPDNIKNLGSAAAGPEESANDVLIDVDTIPAYPAWAPEKNVADMLFKYAEMGDVQV